MKRTFVCGFCRLVAVYLTELY